MGGQHGQTDMDAGNSGRSAERGSGDDGGPAAAGPRVADVAGGGLDRGIVTLQRIKLPSQPATETVALLGLIERAAADPSVDLDRMERMYAMYERASARSAKSAYIQALASARAKMPTIIKRGVIVGNVKEGGVVTGKAKQSTYAKWEDVVDTILPVLDGHGLVLSFRTDQSAADRVTVKAVLAHVDGHSEESSMSLPLDAGGGKNNVQSWGSSVSYGKRYTAFALLNLVGRDEDNDGAGAPAETISEQQQDAIREALDAAGKELHAFCKYFKIEALPALPAAQYERAMTAIKGRR